ncbi:MAG: CDF family Co(II)/Ni(II) efflux transporter DmeF [Burkholderiales bacterium]
MTTDGFDRWRHGHVFDTGNAAGERGTRAVAWLTAAMMVVEIAAGWWFNSMALLADGFHMSSHALAIGLSAFAYAAARRLAHDPRFAFGTWKIEVLAGFASAVLLLAVVAAMVFASVERLLVPQPIRYGEAMLVAVVGLAVNVASALLLGHAHHDGHGHGHVHHHAACDDHHHHDLNLKSAYVHVIADAATSVLAIAALGGGWLYGWSWLDPVMGLVGATLVAIWAKNLLQQTGRVLLDREMDHPVVDEIREVIAARGSGRVTIVDLHVWRVGRGAYSCALALVSEDAAVTPAAVKDWLRVHEEIVHTTIEVNAAGAAATPPA